MTEVVSRPFPAQWPGECARDNCDARFEEGELIRRLVHPHNGRNYVHDHCPLAAEETYLAGLLGPQPKFCSLCNMYHNGECL